MVAEIPLSFLEWGMIDSPSVVMGRTSHPYFLENSWTISAMGEEIGLLPSWKKRRP